MKLPPEEIGRKLTHLAALAMPIGLLYSDHWGFPKMALPSILGGLLAGTLIVESLRFKYAAVQRFFLATFGRLLRTEEHAHATGTPWLLGAALACSLLFAGQPHISFMALSLFVLGDAAAALVGIRLGRIKIGQKSLEGTSACFACCLILFYGVFPHVPGLLAPWNGTLPYPLVLGTSLAVALFELVPFRIAGGLRINDNLAVPVLTGCVIWVLERLAF